MQEIKDIYKRIKYYKSGIKKLKTTKAILPENKKLILQWLKKKEKQLQARRGREYVDEVRYTKTLMKYLTLLKTLCRIIHKPFKKLTNKDLKNIYEGFETGSITKENGEKYSRATRLDFYNKIFKSDFFELIGKKELCKKIFLLERRKDENEVRFFYKTDLEKMSKYARITQNKLILYMLFDTGMRIGTLLNLKAGDIERRHNETTNEDYYIVHIRADYTKTKKNRTISILMSETSVLLEQYLEGRNPEKFLFDVQYATILKMIKRVSKAAKVLARPVCKPINHHDFRRSCITHLLSEGFSEIVIKKRVGHNPSSTIIDSYVNYLGIDDEKAVTKAQEGDLKSFRKEHYKVVQELKRLHEERLQSNKLHNEQLNEVKMIGEATTRVAKKVEFLMKENKELKQKLLRQKC